MRDPHTGKYRSALVFVLTLGYSPKCIRLLLFGSSVRVDPTVKKVGLFC